MASIPHDLHVQSLAQKCAEDNGLTTGVYFQFNGAVDDVVLDGHFNTTSLAAVITALQYFIAHYNDDDLGQ